MRNNAVQTIRYLTISIFVALAIASATVTAQEPPILPDGNKLEGTWNMQVQWRTCDDGTPQLQPTPDVRSFARGGVMTELNSSLWCDVGQCASLGVWKHLGGRSYISTYKRFRRTARAVADADPFFDPVDYTYTGFVIVVSNITYETNDTLTTSDRLRFYDAAGNYAGQDADRCRTATGARFTGEN